MSQGAPLVDHSAHEALGVRPVPGTLLQLREWVALLPIISRPWIVVLWVGEGYKAISPTPCAIVCTSRRNAPQRGTGFSETLNVSRPPKTQSTAGLRASATTQNFSSKIQILKTSLVVEWMGIHLPMQAHGFHPWSQKIPHAVEQLSLRTTTAESMGCSY